MLGCLSGTRRPNGATRTTRATRVNKEGLTNLAINSSEYLGIHSTPHSSLAPAGQLRRGGI